MPAPDYLERTDGGHVFTGSDVRNVFRASVVASALDLYARTGLRTTRGATPTRLLTLAAEITGLTFKRGQYREAADAVRLFVEGAKRAPRQDEPGGAR